MEEKYGKQIRNILAIMLAILMLAIFKVTASVSVNLVLSIFLCFLILPFTNSLEKSRIPSALASVISILVIVVVIFAASWFMVSVVNSLISTLPSYSDRLVQIDNLLVSTLRKWVNLPEDYSLLLGLNVDWMAVIMPALKKVSSQTVSILSNALITLLLTVFLLLERHTIVPKIIMMSSNTSSQQKAIRILDNINRQVSKYLFIKTVVSLITGITFYFIAVLTKLAFAPLWGVLAFLLNFIPSFGSIIVTLLTIFMAVVQFLPSWKPIIIVATATTLAQNLYGNIIEPRIQGSQLNLSAFVILVSASVFGYVWGIVGMFLAVPLLSVLVIVFSNMDSTKGIAIALSSGKSIRKRMRSDRRKQQPSLFGDYSI